MKYHAQNEWTKSVVSITTLILSFFQPKSYKWPGTILVLWSSIFPFQPEDLEWGAKRLQECLEVAPQPSSLPQRSAGISSVQGRGTEANQLPQLVLNLLSPKSHRETGDSGNDTSPSLSPHHVQLQCLLRSSSMQAALTLTRRPKGPGLWAHKLWWKLDCRRQPLGLLMNLSWFGFQPNVLSHPGDHCPQDQKVAAKPPSRGQRPVCRWRNVNKPAESPNPAAFCYFFTQLSKLQKINKLAVLMGRKFKQTRTYLTHFAPNDDEDSRWSAEFPSTCNRGLRLWTWHRWLDVQ